MYYQFDTKNHFYHEVVLFVGTLIGLHGVWAYKRSAAEIERVLEWSNLPHPRPDMMLKNVVIPNNHEAAGNVAHCTITNGKQITEWMQTSGSIEIVNCVDQRLVSTDVQPGDTLLSVPLPPSILTLAAQSAVNSAYERLNKRLNSHWGTNPRKWPGILQYFRHVRNAASHGNRFELRPYRGIPAIDPSNPPMWRTSIMQNDSQMKGVELIGGWWKLGDVQIFLGDVDLFLKSNNVSVSTPSS